MSLHLYVAERNGLTKIGVSGNPAVRVASQRAKLIWSQEHIGAGGIEGRVIEILRRKRVPGKREWFAVRPQTAIRVVRRAMRQSAHGRMERGLIIERTMAGLAAGKARGRVGGRKPSLTPEKEAEAIAMLRAGARPADVAKALKVGKSTIYGKMGGDWAPQLQEGVGK